MRRSTSICRARPATEVGCNKKEMGVYLSLLAGNPGHEAAEQIANEALQFAQLINATGTADAVAKMSARFARGDGELAKLVRDRQDAEARRPGQKQPSQPLSASDQERNPALEPACATRSPLPQAIEASTPNLIAVSPSTGTRPLAARVVR